LIKKSAFISYPQQNNYDFDLEEEGGNFLRNALNIAPFIYGARE
jgi:hypothetical protein